MQAVPLEDGIALSLRDVTAQRAAERARHDNEARRSLIYNATTDMMFLIDVARATPRDAQDAARSASLTALMVDADERLYEKRGRGRGGAAG